MPRRAVGYWDKRSKRYFARLGEVNPKTGKRRAVQLRHEDGRAIAEGDRRGLEAAVSRRLAELEAAERRAHGPTVAEVCAAFVRWHAENGSAGRTVKDHYYHLSRWARVDVGGVPLAERPAAEVVPEDVWAMDAAGLGSLRLAYASVLACWAWAARPVKGRDPVRMIPSNPLAKLAKPPRGKVSRKLVGWPAVRRLVRFAFGRAKRLGVAKLGRPDRTRRAERLRALALQFMAHTGCRPGEAAALEWGDLDLARGLVTIPAERTKTRKTGRDRRFAVPRRLARALSLARADAAAHPRWVFVPAWARVASAPSPRDLMKWWRNVLKPAAVAAGLPVPEGMTLYWLRHDFQSAGLAVASAEEVSMFAGNSPKVLLETYAHQGERAALEIGGRIAQGRRKAAQ